jgi:hypothetical protein
MENNRSEKITPTTKLFAGSQQQFTPTTSSSPTTNNNKIEIEIRATTNKTKQNKQTNKKPGV